MESEEQNTHVTDPVVSQATAQVKLRHSTFAANQNPRNSLTGGV